MGDRDGLRAVGVICECNPLHYGHLTLLRHIRTLYPDHAILALMSGHFVQRGEPSIHGKYQRAKALISPFDGSTPPIWQGAHADLVLELPFPFSCGSAEYFARGSVELLNELNGGRHIIDILAFGCEDGDAERLKHAAERLQSAAFAAAMQALFDRNTQPSYARARSEAYAKLYGEPLPDRPNEILAIEYYKALRLTSSAITPVGFARLDDGYSATEARRQLRQGRLPKELLPPGAAMPPLANPGRLLSPILSHLRLTDPSALSGCAEMEEGLENRLYRAAMAAKGEDLFDLATPAHLTRARVRRAALFSLLGVTKSDLGASPAFTRLLAANGRGRQLLKQLQKGALPIFTGYASAEDAVSNIRRQLTLAERAEALYALACELSPADRSLKGVPFITE